MQSTPTEKEVGGITKMDETRTKNEINEGISQIVKKLNEGQNYLNALEKVQNKKEIREHKAEIKKRKRSECKKYISLRT